MKNRMIVAAVFVPVLLIVLLMLPSYAFAAIVVIACAFSSYELTNAIGPKENTMIMVFATLTAVAIPVGVFFKVGEFVFASTLLVYMCVVFIEAMAVYGTDKRITFSQIMTSMFAGAIIPFMLSTLISLRNMQEGYLFALLPIISAFTTDAGAYFTGVFLGKHKAFPLISPNKTVEGYVGGLVIGTAALIVYGALIASATDLGVRFWALVVYGVVGALITSLGDLAFSLIKREYDIKDYGRVLPGHGGMLDRFDSTVFAAPAIYLMVSAFPAIVVK